MKWRKADKNKTVKEEHENEYGSTLCIKVIWGKKKARERKVKRARSIRASAVEVAR